MKTTLRHFSLVFLGGAIGTAVRYAVSFALPGIGMLFLVNLVGAGFLGVVNSHKAFKTDSAKLFWGVGFAGGFTTMSGVALWLVSQTVNAAMAPFTVLAMFASGVAVYFVGLRLGARLGATTSAEAGVE